MTDSNEALYYQHCRDINGNVISVDTIRQSGRLVGRFDPSTTFHLGVRPTVSRDFRQLVVEVTRGLTRTQRRTWLKLIYNGLSITQIAFDEQVSRTAIYKRIHQMIRKNGYVDIWWRGRESQH